MTSPATRSTGLLISRDLFFTSKVTGTAAALGLSVQTVGDPNVAINRAVNGDCRVLFLDLADDSLDVAALLARLPRENRPVVIAFGSHVATARLESARVAGCDEVMPRSKFSATLPEILRRALSPP